MAKLVSKTYADALFELAVEKGCEDAWLEDAKALLEILHENEELAKLMNHPQIVKEEKIQIIENIFKGKTADEIVGLMCQLIEKDHFQLGCIPLDLLFDNGTDFLWFQFHEAVSPT